MVGKCLETKADAGSPHSLFSEAFFLIHDIVSPPQLSQYTDDIVLLSLVARHPSLLGPVVHLGVNNGAYMTLYSRCYV